MNAIVVRPSVQYTGEVLGDRIVFDDPMRAQQTSFVHAGVDNYVVQSVLPQWDETLSRTVIDPLFEGVRTLAKSAAGQVERVFRFSGDFLVDRSAVLLTTLPIEATTASAFDAVRYVERTLGLPVTDIVKSCGISRRTFYSWQKPGARQPRLASEGRLWLLVQMTEDLEEVLGSDVSQWMRSDPERRALVLAGEYDVLLAGIVTSRTKQNELAFPVTSKSSTLPDEEVDLPRTASRRVPARSIARKRSARG